MRLRTFEAPSLAEALRRMREALGEEAVLVESRKLGEVVQVTAAVEGADLATLLGPEPPPSLRASLEACLARHAVPRALREELLAELDRAKPLDPAAALGQLLAARFRFAPLEAAAPARLALVGPAGAGKTATAVRLAAHAVVAGRPVRVVAADPARTGAVAQLTGLLQPLRLAPQVAAGPEELARVTADAPADGLLLVDTGGVNPFHAGELAALAELLRAARAEAVLVLPAGLDRDDSVELAANLAGLGARRMVVSKLDAARRLGGVLAAADLGIAFAGAGISPVIGRGLAGLTAAGLARVLLHKSGSPA